MQKAANPDEAYAVASAVQDGFTKQEFVEVMQAINAQAANEISDDDLAQVAGGGFWDDFKKSMSVVTKISSKITGIAGKAAAA